MIERIMQKKEFSINDLFDTKSHHSIDILLESITSTNSHPAHITTQVILSLLVRAVKF